MNKTILITGGGARIGKALALGLAEDGWAVAVHYNRSAAPAESVCDQINNAGGNSVVVRANLNIPMDVETLVERASSAIGSPLTALINNASTFSPDTAHSFTKATYDHHFDVNLHAPLTLSKQFATQLPENETGVILNMIDQRVLKPRPEFFTYGLSKSALYAATKTMAQAFAPRVRVCGIGPGPSLQSIHQTPKEFADELERTLLGTGSPPETLLDTARYLLNAKAVTGQMIAVDGGQHLRT